MNQLSSVLNPVANAVVSVNNLVKVFGKGANEVRAIDGVSVDIERGKLTAVMGPSGCGKSTLMHCMVGLEKATSGSVLLNGKEVTQLKERQLTKLRRDDVGFIFQSFNLVPNLNARENIELPANIAGRKIDQELFEQVVAALGLAERLMHRPAELSGGQQQRVACARAMIGKPAIVFADEPTGNLDSKATEQVLKFLRDSVKQNGQTVVMVTHEAEAAAIADRVLFLSDGKIIGEIIDPTREAIFDVLKTFE